MKPFTLVVIIAIAFGAGVAWGRRVRRNGPPRPRTSHPGYWFTDDVRSSLARSREEACLLGNDYVGPEHILLGLTHVNAGTAALVLERLHIQPATLRTSILGIVQRGKEHASQDLPYTSRAKRVLEKAMIEARDLGHDYVGLEHLLLGLVQDGGLTGQILTAAGADEQTVRRETLAVLSTDAKPDSPPPPI